jgi:subtilase family serine protease
LKRLVIPVCLIALLALLMLGTATGSSASSATPSYKHVHVCSAAPVGFANCHAIQLVLTNVRPASSPAGYNPADLQSAYKLSSSTGSSQTVAIVDAFNDPNAESDLAVYRSQFGLSACTTANGCFRKVNQTGGTHYPRGNTGWAEEISLDLDMVSAICPNCHILLVEASTNSFANLAAAVDEAATLGANEISNSYGGSEYSNEVNDQSHYNHPGIAITVSSGDSGYGVQFPAASQYVTAVGGTSLTRASNSRSWSETAWSGAGSGCSAFIPKPSWQTDSGCSNRTVADVSADADPNTGVSVYDTYHVSGWLVFGGTSVASPIIASVYALAGNAGSVNYGQYPYLHSGSLFDVTSGSNGSCGGSYLCTAGPGYDGPTGLGTPDGTGGF